MKILTIVLSALLVLFGASACSEDQAESDADSSATYESAEGYARDGLDPETVDTIFLTLVRDSYPTMFMGVDDSTVITLARGVCQQFDAGRSFNEVVMMGVQAGYTFEQIGGFIGASTPAYCPQHDAKVS